MMLMLFMWLLKRLLLPWLLPLLLQGPCTPACAASSSASGRPCCSTVLRHPAQVRELPFTRASSDGGAMLLHAGAADCQAGEGEPSGPQVLHSAACCIGAGLA